MGSSLPLVSSSRDLTCLIARISGVYSTYSNTTERWLVFHHSSDVSAAICPPFLRAHSSYKLSFLLLPFLATTHSTTDSESMTVLADGRRLGICERSGFLHNHIFPKVGLPLLVLCKPPSLRPQRFIQLGTHESCRSRAGSVLRFLGMATPWDVSDWFH